MIIGNQNFSQSDFSQQKIWNNFLNVVESLSDTQLEKDFLTPGADGCTNLEHLINATSDFVMLEIREKIISRLFTSICLPYNQKPQGIHQFLNKTTSALDTISREQVVIFEETLREMRKLEPNEQLSLLIGADMFGQKTLYKILNYAVAISSSSNFKEKGINLLINIWEEMLKTKLENNRELDNLDKFFDVLKEIKIPVLILLLSNSNSFREYSFKEIPGNTTFFHAHILSKLSFKEEPTNELFLIMMAIRSEYPAVFQEIVISKLSLRLEWLSQLFVDKQNLYVDILHSSFTGQRRSIINILGNTYDADLLINFFENISTAIIGNTEEVTIVLKKIREKVLERIIFLEMQNKYVSKNTQFILRMLRDVLPKMEVNIRRNICLSYLDMSISKSSEGRKSILNNPELLEYLAKELFQYQEETLMTQDDLNNSSIQRLTNLSPSNIDTFFKLSTDGFFALRRKEKKEKGNNRVFAKALERTEIELRLQGIDVSETVGARLNSGKRIFGFSTNTRANIEKTLKSLLTLPTSFSQQPSAPPLETVEAKPSDAPKAQIVSPTSPLPFAAPTVNIEKILESPPTLSTLFSQQPSAPLPDTVEKKLSDVLPEAQRVSTASHSPFAASAESEVEIAVATPLDYSGTTMSPVYTGLNVYNGLTFPSAPSHVPFARPSPLAEPAEEEKKDETISAHLS